MNPLVQEIEASLHVLVLELQTENAKLRTALKSLCFDAREVLTLVEPEYQHGCDKLQARIEQCETLVKQDALQPAAESEEKK